MNENDENFDDLGFSPEEIADMGTGPEPATMSGPSRGTVPDDGDEEFEDDEYKYDPPAYTNDVGDEFSGREIPEEPRDQAGAEKNQSQLIDEAKPSVKDPRKEGNQAKKLNRNRLLIVAASTIVAFILVFMFLAPQIKLRQKNSRQPEFQKNDANYLPRDIFEGLEDGTSRDYVQENEYLDEKFGPPGSESAASVTATADQPAAVQKPSQKQTAPAYQQQKTTQQTPGGSSTEITTNRNEQQKPFSDVSITEHDNPLTRASNGQTYAAPQQQSAPDMFGRNDQSYTPTSLNDSINAYLASLSDSFNYAAQNGQQAKQDFWKNSGGATKWQWNSDYSLWKGTVIPAVLETGINTDLPGPVTAIVTENVYSSMDHRYLLIPQGSKLYANYDSSITYGQSRVQVAWNTLIRPDGLEINLGSVEGVDPQGYSGYAGSVSEHPFAYAKAFGLIALFSIIDTKIQNTQAAQTNTYVQNSVAETYQQTQQLTNRLLEKVTDIQPTIKIPGGTQVSLITNLTMDLPPMEKPGEPEKYIRRY